MHSVQVKVCHLQETEANHGALLIPEALSIQELGGSIYNHISNPASSDVDSAALESTEGFQKLRVNSVGFDLDHVAACNHSLPFSGTGNDHH